MKLQQTCANDSRLSFWTHVLVFLGSYCQINRLETVYLHTFGEFQGIVERKVFFAGNMAFSSLVPKFLDGNFPFVESKYILLEFKMETNCSKKILDRRKCGHRDFANLEIIFQV